MRVLVVTAVAAERDAVARGLADAVTHVRHDADAPGPDGTAGHGPALTGPGGRSPDDDTRHGGGTAAVPGAGTSTAAVPGAGTVTHPAPRPLTLPGYGPDRLLRALDPGAPGAAGTAAAGRPGGGPDTAATTGVPADVPVTGVLVDVLDAGVGPAAAAAATGTALTAAALRDTPYDLVVSAGIGGGFAGVAAPPAVVMADTITAADLGAETPGGFLPVTDLGFGTTEHRPPDALVRAAAAATGAVRGTVLTVSTVTGSAERAAGLRTRHPGAVAEAMEGFGVAEAAAAHGVPVLEVRTISNPVGPRDRAAWRIREALDALRTAFRQLVPVFAAATVPPSRDPAGTPHRGGESPHKEATTMDTQAPGTSEASGTPAPGQPLKIAYSPCPNDTFVFHAWAHGRVPGAPALDVTFADIDITNGMAERGEFDVLKVSYAVLPWVLDEYALLPCGGALGRGCGPLVLTRDPADAGTGAEGLAGKTVAVPSERSTAYLLFRLWAADLVPGGVGEVVVLPFHEIMPAVRDGKVDAGLVIHEARFTYQEYGLHRLADLGEYWEDTTGLPIPLGAIIAKRSLGAERLRELAGAARASVRLAWDDPAASRPYVLAHAQEMDPAVAEQHIGLYVNEFTADLGEDGYAAVRGLLTRAAAEGLVPPLGRDALDFG